VITTLLSAAKVVVFAVPHFLVQQLKEMSVVVKVLVSFGKLELPTVWIKDSVLLIMLDLHVEAGVEILSMESDRVNP